MISGMRGVRFQWVLLIHVQSQLSISSVGHRPLSVNNSFLSKKSEQPDLWAGLIYFGPFSVYHAGLAKLAG
jgi:hypothetical protein